VYTGTHVQKLRTSKVIYLMAVLSTEAL